MQAKHRKLPSGLFYTPSSPFLYFKIKYWDEKRGAFVWSSPRSSRTTDIADALRIKNETQAFSNQINRVKSDTTASHRAALEFVNTILAWNDVPELKMATWTATRDKWLATEKRLFQAKGDPGPGKNKMAGYNTYVSRLRQFDGWLDGADPLLVDINRDDAQMFYSDMLDQGYRSGTIKATMKILRRIFADALQDGHVKKNPWIGVKTLGNQYRQNDPFSTEDISAIWAALDGLEHSEEWRTACMFGVTIGARLKDCTLRGWDEIILDSEMPHLFFSPGKTLNKANRERHDVKVPVVDPLLSRLKSLDQDGKYLTPHLAEKPTDQLSNTFSNLLRDLKIPMRVEPGLKTWYSKGFHSFRHTVATALAENGVSKKDRMDILGHTDEVTHHQYTHPDDKRMRGQLESALSKLFPKAA